MKCAQRPCPYYSSTDSPSEKAACNWLYYTITALEMTKQTIVKPFIVIQFAFKLCKYLPLFRIMMFYFTSPAYSLSRHTHAHQMTRAWASSSQLSWLPVGHHSPSPRGLCHRVGQEQQEEPALCYQAPHLAGCSWPSFFLELIS